MTAQLDQVLTTAKEQMLKQGEHPPMVVVDAESKPYWIPITEWWNDDHTARAKALLLLGREFALSTGVTHEKISAIYLVQEVWVVDRRRDELQGAVEDQSDRRECLSVLELRSDEEKTLNQTLYFADIIRQGGVVDLGPAQKRQMGAVKGSEGTLLPSFLAGVGSARMGDRQFMEFMQNVQDLGGK